jgi:uncharacterized membrane protein YebE (DUF533 family)
MATPGARDYIAGAVLGMAGVKTLKGAGASPKMLKAGYMSVAISGVLGAYSAYDQYQDNSADSLASMKQVYISRFASQNADESQVAAFSGAISQATNTQQLVETMMAHQTSDGTLSSEQLLAIVAPDAKAPYSGDFGWKGSFGD